LFISVIKGLDCIAISLFSISNKPTLAAQTCPTKTKQKTPELFFFKHHYNYNFFYTTTNLFRYTITIREGSRT